MFSLGLDFTKGQYFSHVNIYLVSAVIIYSKNHRVILSHHRTDLLIFFPAHALSAPNAHPAQTSYHLVFIVYIIFNFPLPIIGTLPATCRGNRIRT